MSVPPPNVVLPPVQSEDEALSSGHKFRFMSPDYPQLPFSLPNIVRHGPLFSCLAYKKATLPIVRDTYALYQLRADLLDQWIALDDFLTDVFSILEVMAPMNVVLHLVPKETNYRKPRETEKAARGAASHALHRFQHLITLVSWAMSGQSTDIDQPNPQWVKVLLDNGFPPAMVEMLRDSPVGTFSPAALRVGTIVNPLHPDCCIRVKRMVKAHVPVYIFWGCCDKKGKRNFKNLPENYLGAKWVRENCYPSDEDLQRAIAAAIAAEQTKSIPGRHLPHPIRGSGQKRGETWTRFFARREINNREKEARETPREKVTREQRAQNALDGRVPETKEATVFRWEPVNEFRLRIHISHSTASQIWTSYQGGQKRYDSFADEWDICTEFDPDVASGLDTFDHDGYDVPDDHPASTRPRHALQPNPVSHKAAAFVGGDIPQSNTLDFPNLDDILQLRYGFVYSHSTRLLPSSSNTITQLAMKICEGRAPFPTTRNLSDAAAAFLELLTSSQPLKSDVCDLLDDSLDRLADQYKVGHIIVERQQGTRIALHGNRSSSIFYLIRIRQPARACRFVVCVDDPIAVLQIIRAQYGPDLQDVAVELASRGIPFGTRIVSTTIPSHSLPCPEPPMGLGFLPFDYRPLPSDYNSYLDRRNRLLRRSYGRAALMKGGIIARLALDSLGGRMDMLVRGGPSEDIFWYGAAIKIGEEYLWDDELDVNDELVICGVHKIATGKLAPTHTASVLTALLGQRLSQGEQTSDVSWWPKQSTWEASGLNVGYWSADDETWFQRHLEEIRKYQGTGRPPYHTAADWRNCLKYHKETKKVMTSTRDAAGRWLLNTLT